MTKSISYKLAYKLSSCVPNILLVLYLIIIVRISWIIGKKKRGSLAMTSGFVVWEIDTWHGKLRGMTLEVWNRPTHGCLVLCGNGTCNALCQNIRLGHRKLMEEKCYALDTMAHADPFHSHLQSKRGVMLSATFHLDHCSILLINCFL